MRERVLIHPCPMRNLTEPPNQKEPRMDFPSLGSQDPFIREQFRVLCTKLVAKVESLNLKIIGITSSIAGEGKTICALNLAPSLTRAGDCKVLLLDADLRKSDVSRHLALNGHPGLSEYFLGKADLKEIIQKSRVPGLFVIPSGKYDREPAELFSQERFKHFVKGVAGHFDVVLLDTPPILPVADTVCLKDKIDAFVLIFRTKYTPHPMLTQAVENIGEEKILGVVLNCLDPPSYREWNKYFDRYYRNGRVNERHKKTKGDPNG